MIDAAVVAALAVIVTVIAWPQSTAVQRLASMRSHIVQGTRRVEQQSQDSHVGIASAIAAMCAVIRSGATLEAAVIGTAHSSQSVAKSQPVGRLTQSRMYAVLNACALPSERAHHVAQTAADLAAAIRISMDLGCPAVQCLETVGASYRRARMLDDLRAQAFAIPQATTKLLSALPAVTVLFGEFLGAKPLTFLFGSPQGLACLSLGLSWYVAGLIWMRAMLRDMDSL